MTELLLGKGQVTEDGVYVFPVGEEPSGDDIDALISYHESTLQPKFYRMMAYYKGHQAIVDMKPRPGFRADNRLVANYAAYNVDTFNGFFSGIPPKISLEDDADNEELQEWNTVNDFVDQFSELSKQADVYGRSYMLVYQNEDGETRTAVINPERSFMVYDDTVARKPVMFVNYEISSMAKLSGTVYTAEGSYRFAENAVISEETFEPNIYGVVPAVEFVENEERRGINASVVTLLDALNKAESQKANQVEYFDNAYLKILGLKLPEDEDGNVQLDLTDNQVIYSGDAETAQAQVDFISKPDGDTMQENLINRLVDQIHQITMVPNLNDEAFAGNSSGVALEYKLLPMRNKAVTKERKFTPALRRLYAIVFSQNTSVLTNTAAWRDLKFKFSQNVPRNFADEAETASKLAGVVSQQTQLATLSIVDDPQTEIGRLQDEQASAATAGLLALQKTAGSLIDTQRVGNGHGQDK